MEFSLRLGYLASSEAVELACRAEELGFSEVSLPEHVFIPPTLSDAYPYRPNGVTPFGHEAPWPDPWIVLSAVAAQTTRIRLSTNVCLLPLHHPLFLARTLATLAELAVGRVRLGVGTGWLSEEYEALGVDFTTRGRRADETIVALRKLLGGDEVEHRGDFFSFGPLRLIPAPIEPIPILVAGASARTIERAVVHGDGYVSVPTSSADLVDRATSVREHVARSGRDADQFVIVGNLTDADDLDAFMRLAHAGIDVATVMPWAHPGRTDTTLREKQDALAHFADRILHPMESDS